MIDTRDPVPVPAGKQTPSARKHIMTVGGRSMMKEEERKKAGAFMRKWLLEGHGMQRDESEPVRKEDLVGGRRGETKIQDTGQQIVGNDKRNE